MAYGGGLLSRCAREGTEGSNPSLPANNGVDEYDRLSSNYSHQASGGCGG